MVSEMRSPYFLKNSPLPIIDSVHSIVHDNRVLDDQRPTHGFGEKEEIKKLALQPIIGIVLQAGFFDQSPESDHDTFLYFVVILGFEFIEIILPHIIIFYV